MTIDERIMALGVRLKRLACAQKVVNKTDHQHAEFVRHMAVRTADVKDVIGRLDSIDAAHPRERRMPK